MSALFLASASADAAGGDIELVLLSRCDMTADGIGGAEIVAYDPATKILYVGGGKDRAVLRLDIAEPHTPRRLMPLRVPDFPDVAIGSVITSVAVNSGIDAAAVPAARRTDPGSVALFDRDGLFVAAPQVGAGPDMLVFAPDGRTLLVANEGEPDDTYSEDPVGSVSVIDLSGGVLTVDRQCIRTIGFESVTRETLDESIRVFGPGATPAQDLEPEYIAVSADGARAWVTLQENNAVAAIDIVNAALLEVHGLGFRDFSKPGRGLDASDRDGGVNIQNWPVYAMYQPDAIAGFVTNGQQYLATANEGDPRDYPGFREAARVAELTLDAERFPDAATQQRPEQLGRLNVTRTLGDKDGDGDHDGLYAFGARSFAVWSDTFELVFESGDQFERVISELRPDLYDRANADGSTLDDRSDQCGPEPEGFAVGAVNGRMYAFIGLERAGGVMVYDVTEPSAARFVCYENSRPAGNSPEEASDVGPEGVLFVSEADSPIGAPLLILANEVSGSILLYHVKTP